jgi:hypothetical protein
VPTGSGYILKVVDSVDIGILASLCMKHQLETPNLLNTIPVGFQESFAC